MSDWTPQPDGTMQPSAELIDHVRSNQSLYPNAVSDFARITGKTEEEVQAIFDNQGSSFGAIGNRATDLAQGVVEATATAAEHLVPADYLGDGAKDIRAYGNSLDPKFDSQKGIVENITEGVGQLAPAIGAGLATGGTGWVAWLAGLGVSTLTFSTSDTFAKTMEEVAPGITPDILVPHATDSEDTKALKALAGNAVMDALTVGAFAVAGKALKGLKGAIRPAADDIAATAFEDASAVAGRTAATEAPAATNSATGATGATAEAVEGSSTRAAAQELTDAYTEARGLKTDAILSTEEATIRSRQRERQLLASRLSAEQTTPAVSSVDIQMRDKFVSDVTAIADRIAARSDQVSGGLKPSATMSADTLGFLHKVFDAVSSGDDGRLFDVAKAGIKTSGTVDGSYAQAVTGVAIRQALYEKGIGFDEMVKMLREDPSLASRPAANIALKERTEGIMRLAELDRHLGSAGSYTLNFRKGLLQGSGEQLEQAMSHLKDITEQGGISLFSDRLEFIDGMTKQLDGLGIDFAKALTTLDDLFQEFDAARRGAAQSIKDQAVARMTPEERALATGSYFRMLKDIQTTALLGQLSTTGLNVVTDSLNTMLLPALENGLGKGDWTRAVREYAGYLVGFKKARELAAKAWTLGTGIVDGQDITEGNMSEVLSYAANPFRDNPFKHLMLRLFRLATDASLAVNEFWKAARVQGLAYADGMEMALNSGMGRVDAKAFAREYTARQLAESGRIVNANYTHTVNVNGWKSPWDTRYMLGKLGMAVDNVRNRDDVLGLLSTLTMPFFRTLVNIGSDAVQMVVPPGLPTALRYMANDSRFSWLKGVPDVFKSLDDFTGKNGTAAMNRAVGRQRLGLALTMSAYATAELSDSVDITGSSGLKKWDAKKRAFEEYPPNSLVIGNTSYDLSRMLPFSAPLMLVGILRDMKKEAALQIKGGNYIADGGASQDLTDCAPALVLTTMTLFQDSSAMQGVFGLYDAVNRVFSEGNTDGLQQYAEKYAQQFTPGLVKMVAKNANENPYEGYDFFSRFAASAGLPVGRPKLDFVGDPITYKMGRGLDPLNAKELETDDPLHREFIQLNRAEGLAMLVPQPDRVFDKSFWQKMGVDTGGLLSPSKAPSLVDMQTVNGKNGWDAYRELVYHGRATEDAYLPISGGDGVNVGSVLVRQGQTFKEALTSIITSQSYHNLTTDARAKAWNAVFGFYKEHAKSQLQNELVVVPSTFDGSRYGSPIAQPSSLGDVVRASVGLAQRTQQTQGSPLDAAFAIK